MARGNNYTSREYLYGWTGEALISPNLGNDITQFVEVERVVRVNRRPASIDRVVSIIEDTGGAVRGLKYSDSPVDLSFLETEHVLGLTLTISLKREITVTEIGIRLHHFGEDQYAIMKKASVSSGTETRELIDISHTTHPGDIAYGNEIRFSVPIRNIRTITFELEQKRYYPVRYAMALFTAQMEFPSHDNPNLPPILVKPSPGVLNSRIGWLTDISSKRIARILAGEHIQYFIAKQYIALSGFLMAMLPRLLTIVPSFRPTVTDLPELAPNTELYEKFSLETSLLEDGLVIIPRDETDRYRYAIGVSNIYLGYRKYSTSSEFISKTFETPIIRTISLESTDLVPASFPLGDWVRYFVSVDEGSTWRRISPLNSPQVKQGQFFVPRQLFINSNDPALIREKNPAGPAAYIDTNATIRGVRVKIEIYRPEGEQFDTLTPEVFSYRLRVGR